MEFYNNLFALAYRFYNRFYEPNRSRFRTVMIIGLHALGSFFILIAAIKKGFAIDFTMIDNTSFYLLVLAIFFLVCSFFLKYYSKDRIKQVVLKFEEKNIFKKRLWGYVTIVSLVLEYVIFALLLSK